MIASEKKHSDTTLVLSCPHCDCVSFIDLIKTDVFKCYNCLTDWSAKEPVQLKEVKHIHTALSIIQA